MSFQLLIIICSLVHLISAAPLYQRDVIDTPVVTIQNGSLKGLYLDTFNQDAYLGVPFAQPPLNSLRFVNPQSLNTTWENVQEFQTYGPSCMSSGGTHSTKLPQSEDCLKLNIVKPRGYENENLPVAIWIHGGSFLEGSSTRPSYNLSYIVENSVEIGKPFIGVSINYRLTGFGFLRSREVEFKGYTNVGIRDQIKAIEWIHENIEHFGGDPNHLVIWGESAGGYSVGKLLNSQKLGDYIKGGITESGTSMFADYFSDTLITTEDDYSKLVDYFNCSEATSSFECLQHVDANELNHVFNETNEIIKGGFHATYVDGDIIPKSSFISIQGGEYQKVPLLIGTNTDEGVDFIDTTLNTTEEFKKSLLKDFPYLTNSSIEKLNELYQIDDPLVSSPLDPTYNTTPIEYPNSWGQQAPRAAVLWGDLLFVAGARTTAQVSSLRDDVPVYKYRHNIPNNDTYDKPYIGARHFRELVYVFDNDDEPHDVTLGEQFLDDPRIPNISKTISKLWCSFITDLNPNLPSDQQDVKIPNWPQYKDGEQNLVFDIEGFHLEKDDWRSEQLKFIESIEVEQLEMKK
ncbi:Cholinesterase [Wickerhamomyces ciferrii]|uniref:Carboxylic ester hydrolase n=1 Tax=Wickerhamomyces ciferrii (strain ATCC 14091 / BCRC 22168 / CBS 111 / JCM 3599 / NBRC 0793 / NRRL Y-1031 F-60-10) TaxID=1206466 RepID=K0KIR4_WICCF|nr:Cholinesterase [Wickerhamomyces ciferrii]CCH42881.1 Cholinesterase [Wickerhamomyces ciferrii]